MLYICRNGSLNPCVVKQHSLFQSIHLHLQPLQLLHVKNTHTSPVNQGVSTLLFHRNSVVTWSENGTFSNKNGELHIAMSDCNLASKKFSAGFDWGKSYGITIARSILWYSCLYTAISSPDRSFNIFISGRLKYDELNPDTWNCPVHSNTK